MKKLLINSVFILFSVITSWAQSGEMKYEDVPEIKKTTTYIVLDDEENTLYNNFIKEAAKQYWKITPFEFIKYSQLNEFIQKPNTTFILKLVFEYNSGNSAGDYSYNYNPKTNKFEKGYGKNGPGLAYRYDGIVLVKGGKKKAKFGWNDWMSYSLVDNVLEEKSFYFKIPSYLQIIQNYFNYVEKSKQGNLSFSKIKELYNPNKEKLKTKTLYIHKDELPKGINSLDEIKKYYKYDVKLVSSEEMDAAIKQQDDHIIILNNTFTGNRYYPYFFEANGGNVIYMDMDRNYLVNPAKSIKKLLTEVSN